jgi:hypothetical protein
MIKKLASILSLSLLLGSNAAIAVQTAPQYVQRRITQNTYGAAYTATGSVNHLNSSTASPYPLNKAMWLTFQQQANLPYSNEFIELGAGKGLTAISIATYNPTGSDQTYYEGHYIAYQRNLEGSGQRIYQEGRIGEANGVPSGDHRYKIQRELSTPNRWGTFVDNNAAYYITIAGGNNYNQAAYTTIGIESWDTLHSFTNSTGRTNIWHYPTTASGFQIFAGTMTNADNNNRGWSSNYYPLQNGINAIDFRNQ